MTDLRDCNLTTTVALTQDGTSLTMHSGVQVYRTHDGLYMMGTTADGNDSIDFTAIITAAVPSIVDPFIEALSNDDDAIEELGRVLWQAVERHPKLSAFAAILNQGEENDKQL